jgi:hypothetical protein
MEATEALAGKPVSTDRRLVPTNRHAISHED